MGKKYFNRRYQGTIRINQRRFSLQIRSNYAYIDRNVKAQKRIISLLSDSVYENISN